MDIKYIIRQGNEKYRGSAKHYSFRIQNSTYPLSNRRILQIFADKQERINQEKVKETEKSAD